MPPRVAINKLMMLVNDRPGVKKRRAAGLLTGISADCPIVFSGTGDRTPVWWLRTTRPKPLDDTADSMRNAKEQQANYTS